MRLSTKQLLIVVNPFASLLAPDGRATALCAVDPSEPMGSQYIGARTAAKALKRTPAEERRLASPFGPRDKVSVSYSLKPVSVPDTSYYRQKIEAAEVFAAEDAEACAKSLRSAARAALAAFAVGGLARAQAFTAWRAQGLGAVVDMLTMRTSAKLPPGSDELHEVGPRGVLAIGGVPVAEVTSIEITEGAVS